MKKITFAFFLILLSVSVLAACGGKTVGELPEYEYFYEQEFVDEYDPDVKIDGVLDEPMWQDKQYLVCGDGDGEVEAYFTTAFTEYGIYIGGVAYDDDIIWYGRRDMKNNSCFRVELCKDEYGVTKPFDTPLYEVDAYGSRSYNQTRFIGVTRTIGEPNSHATTCMTLEMFVSWDSLNVDVSEYEKGYPDAVRVYASYHMIRTSITDEKIRTDVSHFFGAGGTPSTFERFGPDGYINYERDGVTVGNAANGLAKSCGWDLSEAESGKVQSVASGKQALFFRDVGGEYFVAEATLQPVKAINDSNPQVGLIAVKNDVSYRAMFINLNSYVNNATISFRLQTAYPDDGWYETGALYSAKCLNGVLGTNDKPHLQVKMVKYGSLMIYFIEDELVYSERVSYLDGDAVPGLYSLGSNTIYTDYSAKSMTEEETRAYLLENDVFLVQADVAPGGTVSPAAEVVAKGGSLQLSVNPGAGYVLTEFSNMGRDLYDDFVAANDNGSYVLENITDGVSLKVGFERLSASSPVRISGALVSAVSYEDDSSLPTVNMAAMTIKDKTYGQTLYYSDKTSNSGAFYIDYLHKKGEYTVGGRTVRSSGVYEILFSSPGFKDYVYEIDLNGITDSTYVVNADDPDSRGLIKMEPYVIGANIVSQKHGINAVSVSDRYDISRAEEGIVNAMSGSSNAPMYLSGKIGRQAVIEFTVENKCLPGTEIMPGTGFVISNRNGMIGFILFGSDFRVMDKMDWNFGVQYTTSGGYSTGVCQTSDGALDGEKYSVRVVHDGKMLAVYVAVLRHNHVDVKEEAELTDADYVLIHRMEYDRLDAMSAYGLVTTVTNVCNVEYKLNTFLTGDEALGVIRKQLYGELSLTGDNADRIRVTPTDGAVVVEDGGRQYARQDSVLEISVDFEGMSSDIAEVSIAGRSYIVRDGAAIQYKVSSSAVEIYVNFPSEFRSVEGKISVKTEYAGLGINPGATDIYAVSSDDGREYVFSGYAAGDGTFSLLLPVGEYDLRFSHEYMLDTCVNGVQVPSDQLIEAQFGLLKPIETVSVGGTLVTGSGEQWLADENSVTSTKAQKSVGETKYFVATGAEFVAQTTMGRLDTTGAEAYPMAGIEMRTAKLGYAILIQAGPFQGLTLYAVRTTGTYKATIIGYTDYVDDAFTLKVVSTGGSLYVFANGQLVTVLDSSSPALESGLLGQRSALGLRSVGHRTRFSDYWLRLDSESVKAATEGYKEWRQVTGTVSVDSAYQSYFNVSSVKISVESAVSKLSYDGAVNADGTYSVPVPSRDSVVTLSHVGFLSVKLDVSPDQTVLTDARFNTIAPQTSVSIGGTTVNGSSREWSSDADSVTSTANGREIKYFASTGTEYVVETKIDKLALDGKEKYPMAGIVVRTASVEYAFMFQDNAGFDKPVLYWIRTGDWKATQLSKTEYIGDSLTLKLVGEGDKISLYANGEFIVTVSDAEILEAENAVGFISVGCAARFSDFSLTVS